LANTSSLKIALKRLPRNVTLLSLSLLPPIILYATHNVITSFEPSAGNTKQRDTHVYTSYIFPRELRRERDLKQ